jgi:UDP-N-acetylglucosamine acyltransferase
VQGNPAAPRGINVEGIRRRGFTAEDMSDIKHAYRSMFMAGLRPDEIKNELAEPAQRSPHVKRMLEFFENSKRLVQK